MIDQMDAEHEVMAEATRGRREPRWTALRAAPTAANAADGAHRDGRARRPSRPSTWTTRRRELEPVYQAKKDDPAIKEMGRKFSKVPPKEGGVFFAWLDRRGRCRREGEHQRHHPGPGTRDRQRPVRAVVQEGIAPVWR